MHPIRHCLIARERAAARADRAGRLPPAGKRPVRALPARAPARRRGRVRRQHRGRRAHRGRVGRALGRARHPPGGGAVRLRGARGRRRGPCRGTRPASSGWRSERPAQRPDGATADGRFEDVDRLLGLPDSPGALVDVLQEFAGRERQPEQDRVAAAQAGAGPLHLLRRPRGRARPSPRSSTRSTAVRASVETLRVLGCYPAARSRLLARSHPAPVTLSASAVEAATARAVTPAAPAGSRGAESGEALAHPRPRGRGEPTRGTCTPSAGGRPAPG